MAHAGKNTGGSQFFIVLDEKNTRHLNGVHTVFGKVLDASDQVLHEPRTDAPEMVASALALEFETDLRNI